MREKSHYEVLGVTPVASLEDIKREYRARSLVAHPDISGSDTDFIPLKEAYLILSDSVERRKYDMVLRLMWDACGDCGGKGVKYRQKGFTSRIPYNCPACEGKGFFSRSK